ncbi:MAG: hypothetical protein RLZZ450_545 [Pseudomonadota bacterium]|jgi:hypothetical protein
MSKLFAFALVVPHLLLLSVASAQTTATLPPVKAVASKDYVTVEDIKRTTEKPQGFAYGVTLAANLNVASNNDVVGQVNGNSLLFGASGLTKLSYLRDRHEWLNTGSLNETFSRTPAVNKFLKSNDLLDVQSLYSYFLREWTGPFVRVALQTSLFQNYKVTAAPVTYTRSDLPAGAPPETDTTQRFKLSDGGQPLTINESLGWFFEPVHSDVLTVNGRVGFGGRHTFADGARSVKDNNTYVVLNDVHQAGAELFVGIDGKEFAGRLLYNAGLSALFPLINNDDTDRSVLELTKVALQAAMGMGVFSWLSVNYQLKVIRDVQLVDAIQVQNALLLSLQWAKSSPLPNPPKTQAELDKEKIAALEARATSAEQRAAAAEARVNQAAPVVLEPPAQPEPVVPATPGAVPAQPVSPAPPVQ